MSDNLIRRIESTRNSLTQMSSKRAEAEGALKERMRTLKDEFDCDSLEDAEDLLEEKQMEAEKAKEEVEKILEQVEGELEACEA